MKKTQKTRISALLLVLLTLFSALFIPINAAEPDIDENVGIEEIIRIWNCEMAFSICGVYLLCDMLREIECDISIVDFPKEKRDVTSSFGYSHWGILKPGEYYTYLSEAKEITKMEKYRNSDDRFVTSDEYGLIDGPDGFEAQAQENINSLPYCCFTVTVTDTVSGLSETLRFWLVSAVSGIKFETPEITF